MMRNELPYAPPVNGRWYKIFLENDNGNIKETSNDIDIELTTSEKSFALYVNNKYKMLNYIIDPVLENAGYCNIDIIYNSGKCGIFFTDNTVIDNLTLYLYCVRL